MVTTGRRNEIGAMKGDDLAKKLVLNGFDFLTEAIASLEGKPKYSIINFYSAVEIFIKARLLHEH